MAEPRFGHDNVVAEPSLSHRLAMAERREGVIYTIGGFPPDRLGGVWSRHVSFAAAQMLKATLVSAGFAVAVAGGLWLRFCGDAFRCDCVSAGLRCDGGWRAVAGILRGCVSLRLRFLEGALWRRPKKKRSSWDLYGSAWFCGGACGAAMGRHSLHRCFQLPWAQKALPPQSLHVCLRLPCAQKSEPPHSRHLSFRFPCAQKLEPPHSRHLSLRLPCAQ